MRRWLLARAAGYALFSSRSRSAASAANSAPATVLFGCMTMSHPAGISGRWLRTISRIRRRIRLRTTAPPSAFLMLKPKRLWGNWLARKKTVKWELERRFPARYTASKSPRRTSRASRGNSRRPESLGREAMASLLAARRQDLAAALRLHAHAEAVRLGAAAFARLIGALWQNNPPLDTRARSNSRAASAAIPEFISVFDRRAQGQDNEAMARPARGLGPIAFCAETGPCRCTRSGLSYQGISKGTEEYDREQADH